MSTVITLRNESRKKSGINSTNYSNAQVLADMNQAYFVLAPYLAYLQEDFFEEQRVLFNLIANSGLYSLPTDCMNFKQLRLAFSTPSSDNDYKIAQSYDPTDVHFIPLDETNVPTTNPIVDITNNYFRIKPKPTASVTNGGMLYYIAMPSALVNTGDTPVLPLQYHDLLAVYSAREQTFKYEKWQKHTRLDKQWSDKIAELEQLLADRDQNKIIRFKAPQELGGFNRQVPRELPSPYVN